MTDTDLSARIAASRQDWELSLGEPYPPGAGGYVVRPSSRTERRAVLKLGTPHREAEQEADALERWDGDGAVRLLARDDERLRAPARAL